MALTIGEAFVTSEPMTVTTGISKGEFVNLIKFLGSWAQPQELTVIARDKQSNEVVGAMIARDFALEFTVDGAVFSDKFEPIFELIYKLQSLYKQDKEVREGEYLYCNILAVSPRYVGQDIAQNLVQFCLENAIQRGFKTAFAEATNSISQRVFRKCEFVERYEIRYQEYTFQGASVFASVQGHTGTILMEKALQ
jgi:GNAT superfamily N-acetyltransferase